MHTLVNFCRLCLSFEGDFSNMSTGDIIEKASACIGELEFYCNVPNLICNKCLEKLDTFYNFRNQCLRSELVLHRYIQVLTQEKTTDNFLNTNLAVSLNCGNNQIQIESIPGVIRKVFNYVDNSKFNVQSSTLSHSDFHDLDITVNHPQVMESNLVVETLQSCNSETEYCHQHVVNEVTIDFSIPASQNSEIMSCDEFFVDADHFDQHEVKEVTIDSYDPASQNLKTESCDKFFVDMEHYDQHEVKEVIIDSSVPASQNSEIKPCNESFVDTEHYDQHEVKEDTIDSSIPASLNCETDPCNESVVDVEHYNQHAVNEVTIDSSVSASPNCETDPCNESVVDVEHYNQYAVNKVTIDSSIPASRNCETDPCNESFVEVEHYDQHAVIEVTVDSSVPASPNCETDPCNESLVDVEHYDQDAVNEVTVDSSVPASPSCETDPCNESLVDVEHYDQHAVNEVTIDSSVSASQNCESNPCNESVVDVEHYDQHVVNEVAIDSSVPASPNCETDLCNESVVDVQHYNQRVVNEVTIDSSVPASRNCETDPCNESFVDMEHCDPHAVNEVTMDSSVPASQNCETDPCDESFVNVEHNKHHAVKEVTVDSSVPASRRCESDSCVESVVDVEHNYQHAVKEVTIDSSIPASEIPKSAPGNLPPRVSTELKSLPPEFSKQHTKNTKINNFGVQKIQTFQDNFIQSTKNGQTTNINDYVVSSFRNKVNKSIQHYNRKPIFNDVFKNTVKPHCISRCEPRIPSTNSEISTDTDYESAIAYHRITPVDESIKQSNVTKPPQETVNTKSNTGISAEPSKTHLTNTPSVTKLTKRGNLKYSKQKVTLILKKNCNSSIQVPLICNKNKLINSPIDDHNYSLPSIKNKSGVIKKKNTGKPIIKHNMLFKLAKPVEVIPYKNISLKRTQWKSVSPNYSILPSSNLGKKNRRPLLCEHLNEDNSPPPLKRLHLLTTLTPLHSSPSLTPLRHQPEKYDESIITDLKEEVDMDTLYSDIDENLTVLSNTISMDLNFASSRNSETSVDSNSALNGFLNEFS